MTTNSNDTPKLLKHNKEDMEKAICLLSEHEEGRGASWDYKTIPGYVLIADPDWDFSSAHLYIYRLSDIEKWIDELNKWDEEEPPEDHPYENPPKPIG